MRLAEFIEANVEPILMEWESFARGIWPGPKTDPATLRDHAAQLLCALAMDMKSAQTDLQQFDKSKGQGDAGVSSDRVQAVSNLHAATRVGSGFDLIAVVAEYRALRASVIRLWRESGPEFHREDLEDLNRFNEAIDQSLAEAVRTYTAMVERSRQLFLAVLGHDLRNPLNSVAMSAEALSQSGGLNADAADMVAQISSSAAAMAEMIKDLLEFTAGELGVAMPVSPAPMDLGQLAQEVVEEMRSAYPGRSFELKVEGEEGDLAGEWDPARLRQVVSNLLGNAMQHGTGPVELRMGGEEGGVWLTVHNDGPPIPPGALANIFEPLVHGGEETSEPQQRRRRRPGSMGLGLYIARAVVTAHGGTIAVTSSAESGTLFTVHLPRPRPLSRVPSPSRA